MSEYLTTEYVCGKLAAFGVDEVTVGKVFAARLEPDNSEDPDYAHDFSKKYALGVPVPGKKAVLVIYRFGLGAPLVKASPLDEGGEDWSPRWLSIEGPFPIEQASEKAKELTSG